MRTVSSRLVMLLVATMTCACDLTIVDEYTPKNFVGQAVAYTAPLKIDIAKSLIASPGKLVPQAGVLKLPQMPGGFRTPEIDFGWVTTGGAIVIQNTKFAVIVLQEPTLDQGKVTWSCVVHPVEAKPNLCGSDYQNGLLQNK